MPKRIKTLELVWYLDEAGEEVLPGSPQLPSPYS
jgi:hypothetical protein